MLGKFAERFEGPPRKSGRLSEYKKEAHLLKLQIRSQALTSRSQDTEIVISFKANHPDKEKQISYKKTASHIISSEKKLFQKSELLTFCP